MEKVRKVRPPEQVTGISGKQADYTDSYQGYFESGRPLTPLTAGKAFLESGPSWVDPLFACRNKLAALAGLKVPPLQTRGQRSAMFNAGIGETIGLFRVYAVSGQELVLGADDKHLDFRISLLWDDLPAQASEKTLTITTMVYFHNCMGRLYFLPVKPLHRLIVPAMLKAMTRKLSEPV